jgi:hypothetical protein
MEDELLTIFGTICGEEKKVKGKLPEIAYTMR